jgi:hypothetical protein
VDAPKKKSESIALTAAAILVASIVLGASLILAAEVIKPARYEFHPLADQSTYLIYDNESGRATITRVDETKPLAPLER